MAAARKVKKTTKKSKRPRAAPAVPKKTPKKTPKRTTKKATKKTSAKRPTKRVAPAPAPSERALAVCVQLPKERSLTDEEREAMANVAVGARRHLTFGEDVDPEYIIWRIASFVDEVRDGRRPAPKSQDLELGLGVLWGEQVRHQVGWTWVHVSYPDGFQSYALVPDDRAFACFPLNRVPELMHGPEHATNTSLLLFQRIVSGELPLRKKDAYLVIG